MLGAAYFGIGADVELHVLSFLLAQGKLKRAALVGPLFTGKDSSRCCEHEKKGEW